MDNQMSLTRRVLYDTLIVGGIITFLLLIFCFFDLYMIPLGFILGFVVSLINFGVLNFQGKMMINAETKVPNPGMTLLCYFIRFVLYGASLFLAFYLDYIGIKLFAWYSVFAGFLLIKGVIYFKYNNKAMKNESKN